MPVLFDKRPILLAGLATGLLGLLTACANSPTGEALERSLAADSKLKDNPALFGGSSQSTPQNQPSAQLPDDFPTEIPLYPEAKLEKVDPITASSPQTHLTTWSSSDPINAIQSFYQKELTTNNWQIVSQPTDDAGGTFVARRNDVQVTISIPSAVSAASAQSTINQTTSSVTKFDIQYSRGTTETATQTPSQPESVNKEVPSYVPSQPTGTSSGQPPTITGLDKLSPTLRQQIEDLTALGVLTVTPSGAKTSSETSGTQFEANKVITRREFARWLVAANNQIYANRPGQQIRLASDASQPAFQDVPRSNPDFQSIQALAEAGLIPSPLTGDSTAVLFRPDAPLTRENLILWKVPLDTRQALPTASIDAVKQTWGFQDVAKIDPKALRAVLADFQNGEQATIRRVFGYTTLFQPKKPVTQVEAAAALWYFGSQGEGISAQEALQLKRQPSQPSATPEPSPSSSPNQ
ncbi:MAG TPA: S-layer homology domain-containing protein [Coleofasciculaceae cyanobacterium]